MQNRQKMKIELTHVPQVEAGMCAISAMKTPCAMGSQHFRTSNNYEKIVGRDILKASLLVNLTEPLPPVGLTVVVSTPR